MSFIDDIIAKASADRKTIVLPETGDERVLKAACILRDRKIANVVLIGDLKKMENILSKGAFEGITVIDQQNFDSMDEYVDTFFELRKNKGMTKDDARRLLLDPLYFGVMMVKMKDADGMVAGAANSTSNVLRPALQILKTKAGTKLVSSFFIMAVPDCEYGANGTFLFADCGLVENPDALQLSEIAISSARSFRLLTGEEPKVAMLSYSTHGSANSELTKKVIDATKMAMDKAPDLLIDGELQADAAIIDSIAKQKAKGSKVAGKCNTLIFPDLNSGNIAYKLVQRLAKAEAYGPVTQGIAAPVNDLSRGCCVEDIVGVAALTAVQASC